MTDKDMAKPKQETNLSSLTETTIRITPVRQRLISQVYKSHE